MKQIAAKRRCCPAGGRMLVWHLAYCATESSHSLAFPFGHPTILRQISMHSTITGSLQQNTNVLSIPFLNAPCITAASLLSTSQYGSALRFDGRFPTDFTSIGPEKLRGTGRTQPADIAQWPRCSRRPPAWTGMPTYLRRSSDNI